MLQLEEELLQEKAARDEAEKKAREAELGQRDMRLELSSVRNALLEKESSEAAL